MTKKILLITEGESTEVKLMQRFSELFIDNQPEIVPFKQNIYTFFECVEKSCSGEYENLDLLLALKSRTNDEREREILSGKYTDILLFFDYDPQDNKYDVRKIHKLLDVFDDSTDKGRLYISYPMIESFYHVKILPGGELDKAFFQRVFTFEQLNTKHYKRIARSEGTDLDIKRIGEDILRAIMVFHSEKANYIVNKKKNLPSKYTSAFYKKLLKVQDTNYQNNGFGHVVSTCGDFILESYL